MRFTKHIAKAISLVILIHTGAFGQLNIKVGYAGAFPQKSGINSVIERFNNTLGVKLEDKMDPISSLHGITVGVRYRLKRVGFEASWQSLSTKSDYFGDITVGGQDFNNVADKWFVSETDYSFGIENYFGNFGYGASLGLGTLRCKTDVVGSSRKKRAVTESQSPNGKFYLIFQYASHNVGAAIKPYVQFPLGDYDVTSFDLDLNRTYDPSYTLINKLETRYTTFGVSIVLYNGQQE
jgi:hypothetical protein